MEVILAIIVIVVGLGLGLKWIKGKIFGRTLGEQLDHERKHLCRNCKHRDGIDQCKYRDGYIDPDSNSCSMFESRY